MRPASTAIDCEPAMRVNRYGGWPPLDSVPRGRVSAGQICFVDDVHNLPFEVIACTNARPNAAIAGRIKSSIGQTQIDNPVA